MGLNLSDWGWLSQRLELSSFGAATVAAAMALLQSNKAQIACGARLSARLCHNATWFNQYENGVRPFVARILIN